MTGYTEASVARHNDLGNTSGRTKNAQIFLASSYPLNLKLLEAARVSGHDFTACGKSRQMDILRHPTTWVVP